MGVSVPSLLIESTDSTIIILYTYVIAFEKRGNFAHKYILQLNLLNVCNFYVCLWIVSCFQRILDRVYTCMYLCVHYILIQGTIPSSFMPESRHTPSLPRLKKKQTIGSSTSRTPLTLVQLSRPFLRGWCWRS